MQATWVPGTHSSACLHGEAARPVGGRVRVTSGVDGAFVRLTRRCGWCGSVTPTTPPRGGKVRSIRRAGSVVRPRCRRRQAPSESRCRCARATSRDAAPARSTDQGTFGSSSPNQLDLTLISHFTATGAGGTPGAPHPASGPRTRQPVQAEQRLPLVAAHLRDSPPRPGAKFVLAEVRLPLKAVTSERTCPAAPNCRYLVSAAASEGHGLAPTANPAPAWPARGRRSRNRYGVRIEQRDVSGTTRPPPGGSGNVFRPRPRSSPGMAADARPDVEAGRAQGPHHQLGGPIAEQRRPASHASSAAEFSGSAPSRLSLLACTTCRAPTPCGWWMDSRSHALAETEEDTYRSCSTG